MYLPTFLPFHKTFGRFKILPKLFHHPRNPPTNQRQQAFRPKFLEIKFLKQWTSRHVFTQNLSDSHKMNFSHNMICWKEFALGWAGGKQV